MGDCKGRPLVAVGSSSQENFGLLPEEAVREFGRLAGLGGPNQLGAEHVAVVVVTHNSERSLPHLLSSLAAGFEGVNYELVVVDNASTDGSVEIAQGLAGVGLKIVFAGGNVGYAAGINIGVENCAADTTAILVVNPDIEFKPGSAAALLRGLRTPGVGIAVPQPLDRLGARVCSIRRSPTLSRAFGEALLGPLRAGKYPRWGDLVTDSIEYTYEHNVSWAEGSAQLISAECWNRCGGWDESYFLYSEETEYNLRIQDHGFAVRFVPDAQVIHHKGESAVNPKLWSLLMANRVKFFHRRRGPLLTVPYWFACVVREARRTMMGRATSRRALMTLLSPRQMRRPRTADWIS